MPILNPGTFCVIIAGCPENTGLIVEVIAHLGPFEGKEDAYYIRTITGRVFHQVWDGNDLIRGNTKECITDRHKLRPLVGDKDDADQDEIDIKMPSDLVTG